MDIPLLERRAVEAGIFLAMYRSLLARMDQAQALDAVRAAVESLAAQAGREFAALAPGGPSFGHFSTVLGLWQGSGALEIENVAQSERELRFTVTRCAYVERYKAMGLPEVLAGLLSCARDLPFARAYSPHIGMERPEILGNGGSCCRFRFIWSE
ncbi:L-2-amino-thiazoline-4-carboxylic acid hydrolase [Fundidesulfovibrio soli]|uniref:L-2-amino-thiazoline-4-carboxylic acid hydrolase n=1 Tax=Fundidesulfovibrio soli TaxID=2922716 RepID=UPI001FAE956F|nr:L-2-amino-thiazoline-4-carboxylic acid hydrolase [Fundidesulfovibrio soli]